jgi:hypothetical protein
VSVLVLGAATAGDAALSRLVVVTESLGVGRMLHVQLLGAESIVVHVSVPRSLKRRACKTGGARYSGTGVWVGHRHQGCMLGVILKYLDWWRMIAEACDFAQQGNRSVRKRKSGENMHCSVILSWILLDMSLIWSKKLK